MVHRQKSKRKNSDIPFHKTPVGSCLVNLFISGTISIVCGLLLFFLSAVIWIEYQEYVFVQHNTPIIQESVTRQCHIVDYEASGYIDDSTLDDYYDRNYSPDLYITCDMDDEAWNCTCEERESD